MLDRVVKTLKNILVGIALLILMEELIFSMTIVQGMSMNPTIHNDDKLFVNKAIYMLKKPKLGDIIIFHPPMIERKEELFIKRVVAVEGDEFLIENGNLYVNGKRIHEPYIDSLYYLPRAYDYTQGSVPDNMVFVLGDNRNDSNDSRCFGFVPLNNIEGKADLRLWPIETVKAFSLNYADEYK